MELENKKDKLNNTWLISGCSGIGKATLAYRIIRYILKQDSTETSSNNKNGDGLLYVERTSEIFLKVCFQLDCLGYLLVLNEDIFFHI